MTDIDILTPSGPMPCYIARPNGSGPWPGVVVIHDAFGAGQNLQRHADWLAGCGYLAAAPNLLHWSKKFTCLRSIMKDIAARKGRSFDDIAATRLWLKAQDDCTDRIGVIGFCMGGAFAMLLAPGGGYDVAAPNYGRPRPTRTAISPAPAPSSAASASATRPCPASPKSWSGRWSAIASNTM